LAEHRFLGPGGWKGKSGFNVIRLYHESDEGRFPRQNVRAPALAAPAGFTVGANVSVFDQMTDDEQKAMLAAPEALKDA
jgi:hypothetical protein